MPETRIPSRLAWLRGLGLLLMALDTADVRRREEAAEAKKRWNRSIAVLTLLSTIIAIGAASYFTAQSNSINLAALQTVQRAFVVVSRMEVTPIKNADGSIRLWLLRPVIRNSGNTPTKNLEWVQGGVGSFATEKEAVIRLSSPDTDPETLFAYGKRIRASVGPQDTMDTHGTDGGLLGEMLKALHSSSEIFEVFSGTIHYRDVFENTPDHRTKYCYMIGVTGDEFGNAIPAPIRCPRWNCADNECTEEEQEARSATGIKPSLP